MERMLVKERRGDEKQRICVAPRLYVEMGQEIVQVFIAHQRCLHPEIDLEHPRSAVEAQVFCGLELHREAFSEVPPDMDFEVTAIIVGQRSSWDEPPVRGENGDLGELGFGDDALLRVGNGHLPSKPDAGRILAATSRVWGRPRPRVEVPAKAEQACSPDDVETGRVGAERSGYSGGSV